MIQLGDEVQDIVTGFKGVALARAEALYEATEVRVHPKDLDGDGDIRAGVWIEEARLVVTKALLSEGCGIAQRQKKERP